MGNVEGMTQKYTLDMLAKALPEFVHRVWVDEISTRDGMQQALKAVGITDELEFHRGGATAYYKLQVEALESEKAAESKLRSAIARKAGKAVGGMKEWFVGSYTMSIRVGSDSAELKITKILSLAQIRGAAKDWLDGVDVRPCFAAHGFIDGIDAEANERGFIASDPTHVTRPHVREDAVHVVASTNHAPGVRPPGVPYKSDEEAFENAVAYLIEALGPADPKKLGEYAPRWTKGTRQVKYTTRRSSSRNVEYLNL